MFAKLLQAALKRAEYRCSVQEVTHSKQKEMRIADTLEPLMQQHRLVMCQTVINKDYDTAPEITYSLMWQMTRLTRERGSLPHDDRLDALAMAVNFWTEQMAQDNEDQFSKHLDKLRDADLKEFERHVFGRKKKPNRFAHVLRSA